MQGLWGRGVYLRLLASQGNQVEACPLTFKEPQGSHTEMMESRSPSRYRPAEEEVEALPG